MQYKVNPMDQTWENGQKQVKTGHFVPTWRYYWMIQMQNMSDTKTKSSGLFSKTKICNLKSIRPTKLEKMTKNLFFCPLDHSKMIFEWSSMSHTITELLRTVSFIKICNMKSIRPTQVKKLTPTWIDHSRILRVVREISLKINQIFPGHAVFAGISPKVWIFILKLKKWPSMTYISVKIRSKLKNP